MALLWLSEWGRSKAEAIMEWGKARKVLTSVCSRSDDAVALSRRDMLAGIGLAGLLIAAPKLLAPGAAEAKSIGAPAVEPDVRSADATEAKVAEQSDVERTTADSGDVTDLSARRHWRRYYWRRRYWRRRRYWGRRRYWRRRYYW
jgi:hypothetical protein